MSLGARVGYFGYWVFDNLLIISKLKLIKRNPKDFLKPAMLFWWLANVCNILLSLKTLRNLKKQIKYQKELNKDTENE